MAIVEVRDLVKRYQGSNENAVDGIGFEIEEGEIFSLLGPNGAGKTTTISILNTLDRPNLRESTCGWHGCRQGSDGCPADDRCGSAGTGSL